MPKKIIILTNELNQIQKIKDEILKELDSTRNRLLKSIEQYSSSFINNKTISYSQNLAEQINLLKNDIEFFPIDLDVNLKKNKIKNNQSIYL